MMTSLEDHQIQLRTMTDADISLSFDIYVSTRQEEMRSSGWSAEEITHFLYSQAQTQHRYYMQHYHGSKYYIIEYKAEDVGRLYIDDLGDEIRIVDIALLPEYRNQGIGKKLLNYLQYQGKQQQLDVSIHVEGNNPAMSLYKRLGFEFVKEVNGIYHFMNWDHTKSIL